MPECHLLWDIVNVIFVEGYDTFRHYAGQGANWLSINYIGVSWNADFPLRGTAQPGSYNKLMCFPFAQNILGFHQRWSCALSTPLEKSAPLISDIIWFLSSKSVFIAGGWLRSIAVITLNWNGLSVYLTFAPTLARGTEKESLFAHCPTAACCLLVEVWRARALNRQQ